jgi:hypothetical protein
MSVSSWGNALPLDLPRRPAGWRKPLGGDRAADLDDEGFQGYADEAKRICPASRALGAIEIGLDAKLA